MAADPAIDISGLLSTLEGRDNYNNWARSFKTVASVLCVWDLFAGEDQPLARPRERNYFKTNVTAGKHSIKVEVPESTTMEQIEVYRLALEKFIANKKKVSRAMTLLVVCLSPAIRDSLPSYDDPYGAWEYLETEYSDSRKWLQDRLAIEAEC